MQCFICKLQFSGFIGSNCNCGEATPPVEPPETGVTDGGVLVTHNGEIVTNGDA